MIAMSTRNSDTNHVARTATNKNNNNINQKGKTKVGDNTATVQPVVNSIGFEDLGLDVLSLISFYLHVADLIRLSGTNRASRLLFRSDRIWKPLCEEYFGHEVLALEKPECYYLFFKTWHGKDPRVVAKRILFHQFTPKLSQPQSSPEYVQFFLYVYFNQTPHPNEKQTLVLNLEKTHINEKGKLEMYFTAPPTSSATPMLFQGEKGLQSCIQLVMVNRKSKPPLQVLRTYRWFTQGSSRAGGKKMTTFNYMSSDYDNGSHEHHCVFLKLSPLSTEQLKHYGKILYDAEDYFFQRPGSDMFGRRFASEHGTTRTGAWEMGRSCPTNMSSANASAQMSCIEWIFVEEYPELVSGFWLEGQVKNIPWAEIRQAYQSAPLVNEDTDDDDDDDDDDD